jgi:hypothetical protein
MNRRKFIGTTALAGAGLAMAPKCGGKSISAELVIVDGAVAELEVLFPNATTLDKIRKLAKDFDADWTAGKFDSAKKFFENLDTLVSQTITDLEINASTRAKLWLATLGIAVRTIAALIAEQGTAQPAAAAAAVTTVPETVKRIRVLADARAADRILKSVQ